MSFSSLCPHAAKAAAFDPFQHDYMANPAETLRWSREEQPLFYSPQLDYWVVTRYDSVRRIFRDPVTYSAANVLEPLLPPDPAVAEVLRHYGYAMNRTLVNEDEPMHMARRRVLMAPFTPDHLREHESLVRRLVDEAIDRFIDTGAADLVTQLFWEVPFSVALHFLGIDDATDRAQMHRFAIAHTLNAFGRPSAEQRLEIAHQVGQFWQLSGRILDTMRKTPDGPGWMRYSLRQQRDHPDVVTDAYLHSMMMAIIVAAHETTTFATANAVKFLLEEREHWEALCADPRKISPAVEECLRHVGSIASWRRQTTTDVEIEGQRLPAGTRLLLVVHSANHDPRQFDDPDRFDLHRTNAAEHLTFGFGAHQCLGKNLGRLEMQVMIGALTQRLPHLQLVEQDWHYVPNLSFRGPQHLHVRWDPTANPERQPDRPTRALPAARLGAPLATDLARDLRVAAVSTLGPRLLQFRLEAAQGGLLPSWQAGAHIELECGETGLTRAYSLCGDPADRQGWDIVVQLEPTGRGGSAWLHTHLRPGDGVRVRGPRNHFPLDLTSTAPIAFVAGGIGITPIRAQATAARRAGLDYQVHYSGRDRTAMPFLDSLQAEHGARLHTYVSAAGDRNDIDAWLATAPANLQVYACGPTRLLTALADAMARHGFAPTALHLEHFQADTPERPGVSPPDARAFVAELQISGLTVTVPPDRSLLQVLRAHNIDLPSDCEEGLCGACEVGVVAGAIEHRDRVLGSAERQAQQRMMACCSRAAHDRVILDL